MKRNLNSFSCLQKTIERFPPRWQGSPYFGRYGRELVSKPAISFKKYWKGCRRTTLN